MCWHSANLNIKIAEKDILVIGNLQNNKILGTSQP